MHRDKANPVAAGTVDGVQDASRRAKQSDHTTGRAPGKTTLTVRRPPNGEPLTVNGRNAETLALLIRCGTAGLTSGEASPLGWARRTSAYVFNLRRLGLDIITVREAAPDGAVVARYRLDTALEVVSAGGAFAGL